jgi:hypothetical protein
MSADQELPEVPKLPKIAGNRKDKTLPLIDTDDTDQEGPGCVGKPCKCKNVGDRLDAKCSSHCSPYC